MTPHNHNNLSSTTTKVYSSESEDKSKAVVPSKNITGPPVYYPPNHELFASKEEASYRAQVNNREKLPTLIRLLQLARKTFPTPTFYGFSSLFRGRCAWSEKSVVVVCFCVCFCFCFFFSYFARFLFVITVALQQKALGSFWCQIVGTLKMENKKMFELWSVTERYTSQTLKFEAILF